MTTYDSSAVSNAAIAHKKGISLQTQRALRDNPLAVAEADASAPANLLPTVFLGTLTTTSGSTQTLPGLVLTPYKFLRIMVMGVSSSSAANLELGGIRASAALASASNSWSGMIILDLSNGFFTSMLFQGATLDNSNWAGTTSYNNSTTSIVFGQNIGTFDAGTIRVYGEK